jgi:Gpi18-like mannosyltransferase
MRIFTIIVISLIVRLLVSYYQLHSPNFYIQQDSYATYATMLAHGTINNVRYFSRYDTRLFPGYPVLIFLLTKIIISPILAGYLISLVSSLVAIYLFWKLTKNTVFTLVFSVFPPFWVEQATKVATEPVTVMLLLAGLLLYKKNKFFLAGLVLGFATDVRLISVCLFLAIIFRLLTAKKWNKVIKVTLGFSVLILSLIIYNYFLFGGSEIFRQFNVYPVTAQAKFGISQIVSDIVRNIRNHDYRVLLSGFLYLIFSFWGTIKLYNRRITSDTTQILFYWVLFSLIFIFSYGPPELFEDFRRFIVPIVPALIYGILL